MLAHPATPVRWPRVSPVLFLLLAYLVEWYITLQRDYCSFLLPRLPRDVENLQPAVFNYSTMHVIYDDSRAREELGYHSTHTTQEGLCLLMKEWNESVEAKLVSRKRSELLKID